MTSSSTMMYGVLALALAAPAGAQDNYPAAPVRLVVAYAPGATTDVIARVLAQKLSVQMNGTVFVENKIGASGNIGSEFVAKSKPDGYTLLYNTTGVVFSRAFDAKLGYDVLTDLAPVSLVASGPDVLIVHSSVPANNVTEFIAHVRANPDKLVYGSSGIGSITHLGPLLFLQANGLSALHVPYKGGAPAMIDLLGGRLQFRFADMGQVVPLVKDKRVRSLAVSSLKRSTLMPELPTLAETVMPGFEIGNWFGVMAPAKTPPAIVKRLNTEILKALQDADLKARLAHEGTEPMPSTPEEFSAYLRSELERWTKVVRGAGITLE